MKIEEGAEMSKLCRCENWEKCLHRTCNHYKEHVEVAYCNTKCFNGLDGVPGSTCKPVSTVESAIRKEQRGTKKFFDALRKNFTEEEANRLVRARDEAFF